MYSTIPVVPADSNENTFDIVEELASAPDKPLVKNGDRIVFCEESCQIVELDDSEYFLVSITAPSSPAISHKSKERLRQDERTSDLDTNMVKVPMG